MDGFISDAPYVAALLGATLGIVAVGVNVLRDLKVKHALYSLVCSETNEALVSADRVLKNGATPADIRMALLYMLEALATPELGRSFTHHYLSLQASKTKRPGSRTSLSEAMAKLNAKNAELAADAHKALMGLILAMPLISADKVTVEEIRELRYLGEGATNPSAVFGRASKALAMDSGRDRDGVSGVGGGFAAA